jgi:hypothetical protein
VPFFLAICAIGSSGAAARLGMVGFSERSKNGWAIRSDTKDFRSFV